ncbi:MAG: hypothetical protein HQ500_00730 [Flavobacteriales bacterium]|nr:hypothetical protein [Flavobacteriales bacterium]
MAIGLCLSACKAQEVQELSIPYLSESPNIDGDLDDWKAAAFSDGTWNMERIKRTPWYVPKRNRLMVDEGEDTSGVDLEAQYYMGWEGEYLYFGAEVRDNVHDVMDAKHEPKRWYYKDAIAFFMEAPRDTVAEKFGEGDHAFCFVMDEQKPAYGAWWRHGSSEQAYIEEPLPAGAVEYVVRMNPWGERSADYIFEGRVNMRATFGTSVNLSDGFEDLEFSMMIVHCDPDGGEYGGHMLIYGKGDDDATWMKMKLEGPRYD